MHGTGIVNIVMGLGLKNIYMGLGSKYFSSKNYIQLNTRTTYQDETFVRKK
jgi:hypothetical protein